MTRRIVSIAGPSAQFAIADDGTGWYWDGTRWVPWERAPLPQPQAVLVTMTDEGHVYSDPMPIEEAERIIREDISRRMTTREFLAREPAPTPPTETEPKTQQKPGSAPLPQPEVVPNFSEASMSAPDFVSKVFTREPPPGYDKPKNPNDQFFPRKKS